MFIEPSFRRGAAFAALLSTPLAFGNSLLMLMAVNLNVDALMTADALLAAHPDPLLWRWSMILDMFGYYLLIIPLVLVLRRWLGQQSPAWADLFAFALLSYSIVGAVGAAIHALVLSPLMSSYAANSTLQQATIRDLFVAAHDMVMYGLWNTLNALTSGVGWLGFGVLLMRERRALGITMMILGGASLVDGIGTLLAIESIASVGLFIYLFLAPIWAGWQGIDLLRHPMNTPQHATPDVRGVHSARSGI